MDLLFEQEQIWYILSLFISGSLVGISLHSRNRSYIGGLLILITALLAYVLLMGGFMMIPIHPQHRNDGKVFVLGLSRTGTTSITVALHAFGYRGYHALPRLLKWDRDSKKLIGLDKAWADAYDAHSDVHVSLVFQEIAKEYPGDKNIFILNKRDPKKWALSMKSFSKEMVNTFQMVQDLYDMNIPLISVRPTNQLFDEIYGKGWSEYNETTWEKVYRDYENRVETFFKNDPRYHEIDITAGATWDDLAKILKMKKPNYLNGIIPKVDVMELNKKDQILWQLEYLSEYLFHALDMVPL